MKLECTAIIEEIVIHPDAVYPSVMIKGRLYPLGKQASSGTPPQFVTQLASTPELDALIRLCEEMWSSALCEESDRVVDSSERKEPS